MLPQQLEVMMDELANVLQADTKRYRFFSRMNYVTVYLVAIVAVFSSAVATLLVAIGRPSPATAVTAALPGIALVLNSVFKFELRSRWHSEKAYRLQGLYQELAYENQSVLEASQKLRSLNLEMDEKWPHFGELPARSAGGPNS